MNNTRRSPGMKGRVLFSCLIAVAMLLMVSSGIFAQTTPPAGTIIGNQATATYTDETGTTRNVTSNLVQTTVQQVGGLTLIPDLTKTASPGGQVVFPHTLTNTGNGTDSYSLAAVELGTSTFNFTSVTFYNDANGDGVPDDFTPITGTGDIAANGTFTFVVVGVVPASAVASDVNNMTVTATSTFDGSVSASVTDVTNITSNAVINLTKSMSDNQGDPGSGPHTVTLTYTNTGNSTGTTVTILDALPSGMVYVSNSGRWSETGSTVLTDADNSDSQGTSPNTVIYDFGVTAPGQVSAVISQVESGQSGTLTFQVTIDTPFAPTTVNNTASIAYNDGSADVGPFNSNTVPFDINQVVTISSQGDTIAAANQGATIYFDNIITNNGNGTDVFNIDFGASTFPSGTSFILLQSDGTTPLLDSNGDGIPDTGPLATGASDTVVVQVVLPGSATGGPFSLAKTATSTVDPSESSTMTDVLDAITASTVDMTNNSAGGGAPGAGAGPEVNPVTTNSVDPGNTTRFTLYVNNTSSVADNYDLAASTDLNFASITLPSGWTVVFRDAGGTVITNTGNVAAGGNAVIYADVTVPATQTAIPSPGQSLYFRMLSPSTGAQDRKHDALIVNTIRSINLRPNNTGQVFPGGTVVYPHTLSNEGNVTENDGTLSTIALTLTDSESANGWSSLVYRDANNNGVLDPSDPVILTPSDLGSVAAGASVPLLVKVTAPAGAPLGVINTTTLTATTSGTVNGVAAPAAVQATDNTSVILGNVALDKLQALDTDCNGTADGSFVSSNLNASPGECLIYQLTVTNLGTSNVTNVVVCDATPNYSTYFTNGAGATTTRGSVTSEPADGDTGTLVVTVGTLAPGESAVITFGVQLDN